MHVKTADDCPFDRRVCGDCPRFSMLSFAVTVPATLFGGDCPRDGLHIYASTFVLVTVPAVAMSNIVQICPVSSFETGTLRKMANFEAFCLPWVYIPKRSRRPVEGFSGPFKGISAFFEAPKLAPKEANWAWKA